MCINHFARIKCTTSVQQNPGIIEGNVRPLELELQMVHLSHFVDADSWTHVYLEEHRMFFMTETVY